MKDEIAQRQVVLANRLSRLYKILFLIKRNVFYTTERYFLKMEMRCLKLIYETKFEVAKNDMLDILIEKLS